MINKDNFRKLLTFLKFEKEEKNGKMFTDIYVKHFPNSDTFLKVDFVNEQIIYPTEKGFVVNEKQTCNFSSQENAVVFECVNRLLEKGYKPEHFELEPKWKVGHGASGGRADILIRNYELKPILIIECKTFGNEFKKAWKDTQTDGGQLFSYIEQEKNVEFICLYASEFDEKVNNINISQRIISHKDNPKILEQNNKLKSFKDATNVKERYNVWKNTYQLEFTEKGIFEENIRPYQIGKDKYTLDIDTKPIDKLDKEGKYHEFRTKLRQYNISRRENAFEVLVNLFLCKIVDEIENPNDLHFYWKGIAYDNYFELVDRLQKLYQIGMKKFLQEDIIYVSFEEVEKAFWPVKSKKNSVKQHVLDLFRELKFYKGLDFDFIKVHNKTQFDKNAKVLLEIIQMWQGIRLKTKTQNQFLGDMFEYFLDNGIKQTEGQFFTPVPICKYIVMSLPLENIIIKQSEPPLVIDYACGSGHFLTEYATQIVPFVEKHKNTEISEYFKNVYGIEKEDRLAKVAKVSAFMYGQENINILDRDALATNKEIPNDSFNVLVANPPFAVEDFLLTLDEEDRENFELFNHNISLGTNNIQCFFLERAKHLLAPGGVAGIVIPITILSNTDALTIQTREILLKYFDIVAITDFTTNYKIFGQTGTKTVVLFLRRKAQRPEPAEHFWERTEAWFSYDWNEILQNKEAGFFGDNEFVLEYCKHIEIQFDDYKALLSYSASQQFDNLGKLLQYEIFTEYRSTFDASTEIKNLRNKPFFKKMTIEQQTEKLNADFVQFCINIEKQKLYYFTLTYINPQKVLIVKIPTDINEAKQFLGYEWSSAKGKEGITYTGSDTVSEIKTTMFDPVNRYNPEKINYYIQQNFLQFENETKNYEIPESLQKYVSFANLTDMLDYTRKDFNKIISLSVNKKVNILTKWELVKIKDICEIGRGRVISHDYINSNIGDFPVYSSQTQDDGVIGKINTFDFDGEYVTWTTDGIYAGTCFYRNGKFNCTNVCGTLKPINTDILNIKFLPLVLNSVTKNYVVKSANPKLMNNVMAEIKIPLPPKEIQEIIVEECKTVDDEFENAKTEMQLLKDEIEKLLRNSNQNNYKTMKLKDICSMQAGKFVSASEIKDKFDKDLFPCYGGNGLRGYTKTFTHEGLYPLIGRQGALCGNVNIANGKFHATEHAVVVTPNNDIDDMWLFYQLKMLNLNQYATGVAQPGLSVNKILLVETQVPPIEEQKTLVLEIEKLEQQISKYQKTIESIPNKKHEIMRKYL